MPAGRWLPPMPRSARSGPGRHCRPPPGCPARRAAGGERRPADVRRGQRTASCSASRFMRGRIARGASPRKVLSGQPLVKVPAAFERRCTPPDRVVRRYVYRICALLTPGPGCRGASPLSVRRGVSPRAVELWRLRSRRNRRFALNTLQERGPVWPVGDQLPINYQKHLVFNILRAPGAHAGACLSTTGRIEPADSGAPFYPPRGSASRQLPIN